VHALRKEINGLQLAETNLMAQLEAFTPTGDAEVDKEWRGRLQQRFAQIAKQRRAKTEELGTATTRSPQAKINTNLVEELPTVQFDLLQLPEEHQRRLFDAFQLELRYNRHLHQLTLRVTVRADTIDALRQAVDETVPTQAGHPPIPAQRDRGADARASTPRAVSHVWRGLSGSLWVRR
jgi:hypothetical protein